MTERRPVKEEIKEDCAGEPRTPPAEVVDASRLNGTHWIDNLANLLVAGLAHFIVAVARCILNLHGSGLRTSPATPGPSPVMFDSTPAIPLQNSSPLPSRWYVVFVGREVGIFTDW